MEKIVEIKKLGREYGYQGVAGWRRWQNTTTFNRFIGNIDKRLTDILRKLKKISKQRNENTEWRENSWNWEIGQGK